MNNEFDSVDGESFFRERNRRLHYQKAVIARLERQSRIRRLFLLAVLVPLLAAMISLSLILIQEKKFVEKAVLQSDIEKIISNGGDLASIKQSLVSQPMVTPINFLFSNRSDYYNIDTPLSTILSDIRVNAFREAKKDILPRLEPIMLEHEQINPFDKLQVGQRDFFDNIRIKSDNNYINIVNDINNIVDELHEKNMLVDEYLSDSKMSFWISIIAVVLSLIIGGYQIFSARPEAMKKLFLDVMDEHGSKPSKGSSKLNTQEAAGRNVT